MKIYLLIFFLFFKTLYTLAQESASEKIKDAVAEDFNKWLIKGEFETKAEYEIRLQSKDEKLKEITNNTVQKLKEKLIKKIQWCKVSLDEYDAENETFKMDIPECNSIIINVPRKEATAFKRDANRTYGVERVSTFLFTNADFIIQNDNWVLSRIDIIFSRA